MVLKGLFARFFSKEAELSPIEESIERFKKHYRLDRSIYRDIREIQVLYPTITDYTKELEKLVYAFIEHKHYNGQIGEITLIKRRNFYTDQQGFFVSPQDYHVRFINLATEVLTYYHAAENADHQDGLTQSNLYRALPLINNLILLSQTLEVLEA